MKIIIFDNQQSTIIRNIFYVMGYEVQIYRHKIFVDMVPTHWRNNSKPIDVSLNIGYTQYKWK